MHDPQDNRPPECSPSTSGRPVDLSSLAGGTVVSCYPTTGRPDRDLTGVRDGVPAACGRAPQSCGHRVRHAGVDGLGARVFGSSTRTKEYRPEADEQPGPRFEPLSDEALSFAISSGLPTLEAGGQTKIERQTVNDGRIEKVFYPVSPPNENAAEVASWLARRPRAEGLERI